MHVVSLNLQTPSPQCCAYGCKQQSSSSVALDPPSSRRPGCCTKDRTTNSRMVSFTNIPPSIVFSTVRRLELVSSEHALVSYGRMRRILSAPCGTTVLHSSPMHEGPQSNPSRVAGGERGGDGAAGGGRDGGGGDGFVSASQPVHGVRGPYSLR